MFLLLVFFGNKPIELGLQTCRRPHGATGSADLLPSPGSVCGLFPELGEVLNEICGDQPIELLS